MPYLLALTLFLTPLYVWRFDLAGLPVNFLLLWIVFIWLVFKIWLLRRGLVQAYLNHLKTIDRKLWILIAMFFLAGCISLLVNNVTQDKLGQFIVLFLQPISLFLISTFVVAQYPSARAIFRRAIYLLIAVLGLLCIVQYFTLWTLPMDYWGNAIEPKRAVGLFGHPDMLALFLTPLVAWLIPDVLRRLDDWKHQKNIFAIIAWLMGSGGVLLSLSRGAWLGFAVAAVIGIIVYGRKKYWTAAIIVAIVAGIIIAAVPNLRYRVILPFKGEKSSVARLSLWDTGKKMIEEEPIFGKGLTGFGSNWYEYNTDPNLNHYNSPHNILLNFWIDTGLLGLIIFFGLIIYGWWYAWKNRLQPYALGLGLFLVALTVHGLIDTPYLKNDLAIIFWLIFGISYLPPEKNV